MAATDMTTWRLCQDNNLAPEFFSDVRTLLKDAGRPHDNADVLAAIKKADELIEAYQNDS